MERDAFVEHHVERGRFRERPLLRQPPLYWKGGISSVKIGQGVIDTCHRLPYLGKLGHEGIERVRVIDDDCSQRAARCWRRVLDACNRARGCNGIRSGPRKQYARHGNAQGCGSLHQLAPVNAATEDTVDEFLDFALQAFIYHRYPPSRSSPATLNDHAFASESISHIRSLSLTTPAQDSHQVRLQAANSSGTAREIRRDGNCVRHANHAYLIVLDATIIEMGHEVVKCVPQTLVSHH